MRSPRPSDPVDPRDAPLHAICGAHDAALQQAASVLLEQVAAGRPLPDAGELRFTVGALGDPHVWPRAWSITGKSLQEATIAQRLAKFATLGWHIAGVRRCGIARDTKPDGDDLVVVVAIDALADLQAVPARAPLGQTVTVQASMLVPAGHATTTVVGPHGAPRRVPTTLSGDALSFHFAPDQAGPWSVEVTAATDGGSRPVLQLVVYADEEPPQRYVAMPALGEDAGAGVADPAEALTRMIGAVRALEGAPPLQRDPVLDALARAHSEQMMNAHRVAHDLGAGDPASRLRAGGARSSTAGENIGRAKSAEAVHRAFWLGPLERSAIVDPRFKRLGVGVAIDQAGERWATELFTD